MNGELQNQIDEKLSRARRQSGQRHGLAAPPRGFWSDLGANLSLGGASGMALLTAAWGAQLAASGRPLPAMLSLEGLVEFVMAVGVMSLLSLALSFIVVGFAAVAVLGVVRLLLSLSGKAPARDRVASASAAATCVLAILLPSQLLYRAHVDPAALYGQQVLLVACCQASALIAPGAYRDLRRRQAGRINSRLRVSLTSLLMLMALVAGGLSLFRLLGVGSPASQTQVLVAGLTGVATHRPITWLVGRWGRRRFRRRHRSGLLTRST